MDIKGCNQYKLNQCKMYKIEIENESMCILCPCHLCLIKIVCEIQCENRLSFWAKYEYLEYKYDESSKYYE